MRLTKFEKASKSASISSERGNSLVTRYRTSPAVTHRLMASSAASGDASKAPLNKIKFASIQMATVSDKMANLEHAYNAVREAAAAGATLITLPECFNSPFGLEYFDHYAEYVEEAIVEQVKPEPTKMTSDVKLSFNYDGIRPTFSMLSQAASNFGVYLVGGSYPERDASGKMFNTACVFDPSGKRIATHRKMHLFDVDVPGKITFKESAALNPGNGITVFDYDSNKTHAAKDATRKHIVTKVGVGICYDIRFPELSLLMAGGQGARILVFPSAFNMTTGPAHWHLLQRSRALDNQVYVATASPARDTSASYVAFGHSLVADPWGNIIAELEEKPGTLITEMDFDHIDYVRASIPVLSQKRYDIYGVVAK